MNRALPTASTRQVHRDLLLTLSKGIALGIFLSAFMILAYDRFADKRVRMPNLTAEERVVYEEINQYREKQGLEPLELHPKLVLEARRQAQFEVKADAKHNQDLVRVARELEQRTRSLGFKRVATTAYSRRAPVAARDAVREWLTTDQGSKTAEGNFNFAGVGLAVNDKGQAFIAQVYAQ